MASHDNSRNFSAAKHIGPQVFPTHFVARNVLDSGPPLGVKQDLVGQPVRDRLLADGGSIEKVSNALRKGGLAPRNGDRAFQGDNVVSLHERSLTRILVQVNKDDCFSENKEACTVLAMTTPRRKERHPRQPKAPPRPRPEVGPDGLTMPQRLDRLMTDKGVGQTDLARMCSQFYAAYFPDVDGAVQQQHIFNLLRKQSDSWVLPLVAHVFDVPTLWLQFGIGPQERAKN